MPVRLGGHVFAALWIAVASGSLGRVARGAGWLLAICIGAHSMVARFYGPPVLLYAASVLLLLWLTPVGVGFWHSAGSDSRSN